MLILLTRIVNAPKFKNIVIKVMFEYELVLVMMITQTNETENKLHLYNKSCFSKLIKYLAV